jgi:hypothetical protein
VELLLKRSQTSLPQIQEAMSRYFDVKRITPGRHEWIEGELRQEQGLGKHDPNEDAGISISVPYDEKSRRTLLTRLLSPFSGSLYHVTIRNLDLPTTLTTMKALQDLGDVGFGSWGVGGGHRSTTYVRISVWPEGREAQLSKATETHQALADLHDSYIEKASRRQRTAETPPYQPCGGVPSGKLCPRCKFNILKSGTSYCNKYHKAIPSDGW